MRYLNLVAIASVVAGCAAKGDVQRVETQLAEYRAQAARADSAQAAVLSRLLDEVARSHAQLTRLLDSLQAELRALNTVQGAVRGEVTEVQRQLATVRELTGQSQQGLNELRSEIDRRVAPAAGRAFRRVVEVYPDSDEAALARSKLTGSRRR